MSEKKINSTMNNMITKRKREKMKRGKGGITKGGTGHQKVFGRTKIEKSRKSRGEFYP